MKMIDIVNTLKNGIEEIIKEEAIPKFRLKSELDVNSKSKLDDLVTQVDIIVEKKITILVKELMPDVVIIGEESQYANGSNLQGIDTAPLCIAIDPIDGTWNYATGVATFGVNIAIIEHGETTVGMLYDPVANDWVIAMKGEGAKYYMSNGDIIKLNNIKDIPELYHGCIHIFQFPLELQHKVVDQLPNNCRLSLYNSACHEYRTMALGFLDFIISATDKVWDHAAGILIVEECGGQACFSDGSKYSPTLANGTIIICANKKAIPQVDLFDIFK